jgi:hypothetical protein
MQRALFVVSALACLVLLLVEAAAALDYALVPPPGPETTGPQGPLDLILGLVAGLGGLLGMLLAAVAGVGGLIVAAQNRQPGWLLAIVAAGVLGVVGLFVGAFILLGLPRNPFHLFVVVIVVPLTTLAYSMRPRTAQSTPAGVQS